MPLNANTSQPMKDDRKASALVQSPSLQRLAHSLSYLLHPAILMVMSVILISHQARNNLTLTFMDVAILIAGLLPGLFYIYIKTKRGDFSHYHLLFKEERQVVLPLLLAGMVGSFILYVLTGAPVLMLREMVVGLLAGVGAVLISRFWKISLHAAVAMGCAALFIPLSMTMVLILGSLGIIVGLSRLVVRHHTPAQVFVGWLYGFGMTSLLVGLLILRPGL